MSYTPTNWQTGDTITAEKLNNMEGGIENANEPFIITFTPTAQDYSGTMDKTPEEITSAYNAGERIIFNIPSMRAAVDATQYLFNGDSTWAACANITYNIDGQSVLIQLVTSWVDSTYGTSIAPLTPMS